MPPISLLIKPVSGLCNMRCSYCFYADEMVHRSTQLYEPMSFETLETIVRKAFVYADQSVTFAFQGGEPTLAPVEYYRELMRLVKQYNTRHLKVDYALQTNGLSVSDELLEVFQEGKYLIGLSVDGTQVIHDSRRKDAAGRGTYSKVMDTAERLRKARIDYNILCVLDKNIAEHPHEVFNELSSHRFLQFIPCLDAYDGSTTKYSLTAEAFGNFLIATWEDYRRAIFDNRYVSIRMFDNWIRMIQGHHPEQCGFCGQCAPNYMLESNGNVYPCDFYGTDDYLLGNILDTSFLRLSKSEKLTGFIQESINNETKCLTCNHYRICRGSCRRDRHQPDGRIGSNRLCDGYRMFFDKCYSEMTELARLLR